MLGLSLQYFYSHNIIPFFFVYNFKYIALQKHTFTSNMLLVEATKTSHRKICSVVEKFGTKLLERGHCTRVKIHCTLSSIWCDELCIIHLYIWTIHRICWCITFTKTMKFCFFVFNILCKHGVVVVCKGITKSRKH